MITGISKIKGLGVYDNYTRPLGTQEFGIKNLIYGWNYSGKTTLSRLFAQLEAKKLNHELVGCEFSFETDGQPITEKNFEQSNLIVRVFNSDFIRENLHFEGNNFRPILLLGKETEEAQKQIDHIADRIKNSESARRKLEIKTKAITQTITTAKTEAAKNLRQLLKIDPYTATQLGNDIPIVGILDFKLLSDKHLTENTELSLTPDNKKPSTVDRIEITPSIENIHKEAITTLAAVPSFANTIKHLEDHPKIERWVESGLHIHPQEGTCEFCGNTISENRLIEFRAHFSKDLAEHKQKVENLLQRVKNSEIKLSLPKEAEFNPQFRDSYKLAAESLPNSIKAFNLAVRTLADDVQLKVDAPRKLLEPTSLAEGLASAVTNSVNAINTVIEENNQLADNFVTAKAEATKQVRYHYVQQFIDSQEKAGYERKKARLVQRRERLRIFTEGLQGRVEKLQALISQAQLGREKINERLASMLGGEAVQIVVIKDPITNQEQFKLVRKGGKVAKNLSDGERTAIAFSYFLTKLQELKPEDFKQTVVYIDDPISSLDANHIFQITAAIRAIFFKKENENSAWETTCKQLFVSTHNFEFFNLLREIKPESPKQGARLFLIKRISELHSTLNDMPKSLANYQSEYHFLFEVIYRFHQAPDKTDHTTLMLLPNAMRRFIELYTYSRLPGVMKETVDQRAEALFGIEKSKRILKVFHYFSHANTIDRLAGNNELIFDIEYAVRDLIEAITQTDQKHMDALIASL
ncbi:AAA family ATPase [Pseudomonas grimontii]|uniref:AAA family ATPase n=3 Tax=Bacteria TaxID=2 RepID=UPI0021683E57|nr:AAA family ATPase [Pseudomonas grimontii]MCS3510142.1 wobble nucleotide-excising tRNase [Pseudomonas grimontii]